MNLTKSISTLFLAFSSLFIIQSAHAADALNLVGRWRGMNFTGNQACTVDIRIENQRSRNAAMFVTVREGDRELTFPPTTIEAVNQAIAQGYRGQFDVKGPRGINEFGDYYWNFRGGFFNDGRVNYLTVIFGQSYGPMIGGQTNLGCSRLQRY